MRLDEILDVLPSVGLRLELLSERPGSAEGRWTCTIAEEAFGPSSVRYYGLAATPMAAAIAACCAAGVDVTDE